MTSPGIKIPGCSRKYQIQNEIGPAHNENPSQVDKVAEHMAGAAHGDQKCPKSPTYSERGTPG